MSLLGDGLFERARSTSFALLGLAAAVGFAAIAIAVNQDWPLIADSPIPAAPEPAREDASDAKSADVRLAVGPANGMSSRAAPGAAMGDEGDAGQASPPPAPPAGGIAASSPVDRGPDRSHGETPDPPAPQPQPLPVSRPQVEQPAATPDPASALSPSPPDAPVTASDEDEDDRDDDEDDWDPPRDRGRGHDDDWDHGHGHGHGWDDDDH
jgi:hypothetical protein